MSLAEHEIIKAAYTRLKGNLDNDWPVYQYGSAPENPHTHTPYYVEVGPQPAVDHSSKSNQGQVINLQFHVWGNEPRDDVIYSILSNILSLITTSNSVSPNFLSLSGFTVGNQQYAGSDVVPTGDNKLRHGFLNIEITV